MDDLQLAAMIRELESTRQEMSALTDALRSKAFQDRELTRETKRLADLIEARNEKPGFWRRLVG